MSSDFIRKIVADERRAIPDAVKFMDPFFSISPKRVDKRKDKSMFQGFV